ncbi:oligosaccharide flippase family protein [Dongia soli]|uniref:Oligosaccharide flippase family protein n=1 Tax=Dongia soli TaxID=600628 RepID=A0ABU5EDH1_9PROT|nr:oligosaccharide flippase family protein [Dongia soli]MDY0884246.1 oligosaccharide flippase family protein [Dongia soli]
MIGGQVIRYLPSTIIPPLSTFIAIYIYTRLLTPTEVGTYTFTLTITFLWQSVFFSWLPIAVVRFYTGDYARSGEDVVTVAHRGFGLAAIAATVVFLTAKYLGFFEDIWVTWLALPLALSRSLLNVQLSWLQAQFKIGRYNLLEVGQTICGIVSGIILVEFYDLGAEGALIGILIGYIVGLAGNLLNIFRVAIKSVPSASLLREFFAYGLPLSLGSILASALASVDRVVITKYLGLSEVAAYSLAFGLVDRPITLIFSSVSIAMFPVAMHALESQGPAVARGYLRQGLGLAFALAIPACFGIAALDKNVVWVLLGENFREETWPLIVWVTICSFLAGVSYHTFGQSFHFSRQTWKVLFTIGPAAAINIVACIIFVPSFGLQGAIGANLVSMVVLVIVSGILGQRSFRLDIPYVDALKAAVASALMYLILKLLQLPLTAWGLVTGIVVGGLLYGLLALALNIAQARQMLDAKLISGRRPS